MSSEDDEDDSNNYLVEPPEIKEEIEIQIQDENGNGDNNEDRDPSSNATNTASDFSKTLDHGATPFQAIDTLVQPTSSQLNGAPPSFSPPSSPSLPPSPPPLPLPLKVSHGNGPNCSSLSTSLLKGD